MLSVIVPFRDRDEHLARWAPAVAPHLRGVRHEVVVVEQSPAGRFNRGKLLNVGARLADDRATTLCFHDVDMLPRRGIGYREAYCEESRRIVEGTYGEDLRTFGYSF